VASVRPVTNRQGKVTGYRVDVKRTFGDDQLRWGKTFAARDLSPEALADAEAEANAASDLAEADLNHKDENGNPAPIHPADRYRRDVPEPYRPGMTVREWIEIWHPRRKLTPAVERNQRGILDNHVLPVLGWRALAELDRTDVQDWAWGLADDLMPRSQRTAYRIFKAAINEAIVDRRCPIDASPFVKIDLERPEPTGRHALTPEQVAALARHARYTWPKDGEGYGMLIISLAMTGLRAREFVGRRRHDLTLRRTIEVRARNLKATPDTVDQDGAVALPRPKTGKRGRSKGKATKSPVGARSVQLGQTYAGALSAYLAGHQSDRLWVARLGGPLTYSTLNRIVKEAAKAAVAAGEPVPPDATAHWLRKTHRTWLSEEHVPRVAVDEQVGHETPGMQGVYEEPTEVMRQQIRDVLERRYLAIVAALGDSGALRVVR
jgi:hypothetical protein